jgi:hypothetical protein
LALTEEQKMEVALFRFGLIAPLLNNQVDDSKAYLEKISSQVHDVPYYGRREYSERTIRRWTSTSLRLTKLNLLKIRNPCAGCL